MNPILVTKKLCHRCATVKDAEHFNSNARRADGLQVHCVQCMSGARKTARAQQRMLPGGAERARKVGAESRWRWAIQKLYGLTPEQYEVMLTAQGEACAICLRAQSELPRRLSVDHCHVSGKVRGLLCAHCNMAIGQLGDDHERIGRAFAYLRRWGAVAA